MNRFLALTIGMCLLFSCASEQNKTSKESPEFLRLDYKDYSIEYPSDWTADTLITTSAHFFLKAPKESESDIFQENVNLLRHDVISDSVDFEGYVKLQEEFIKSSVNYGNLLESETLEGINGTYQRVMYTASTNSNLDFKFLQYLFHTGYAGYSLTFTALESQYPEFHDTAVRIMDSFELKTE